LKRRCYMQVHNPQWQPALAAIGMGDFNSIWTFPLQPVDVPNKGRGGWSEVCYYELPDPIFDVKALYIKRQQDFGFFDWRRPFKGLPTFEREYRNLVWCLERELPVVKPVAFGVRDDKGHRQAVLITQALDNFFSLDSDQEISPLNVGRRRMIIRSVASVVKRLHESGLQHGCLYPKHIFVSRQKLNEGIVDIRLIDLEKASPLSIWNKGIMRDLDTLNRRAYGWSNRDRLCFLKQYCSSDRALMRSYISKLVS
ncbi:MAG: lipopolysaccharide kinase InaA family protein, partial [Gammaproteobacteria bacterium]|nr:lipopolysaccharide kinase InaA family protein [Gammaproteobacteria bacterium]